MDQYEYNGETYFYNNGKWLTSSRVEAPLAVVSKLNQLLVTNTDFESMSVDELLKIIDGSRASDNIQLASKILEVALGKATISQIRMILPRLTSNYRKMGMPQKSISLGESYIAKHTKAVGSSALYTSLAAAYCDEDDFATGKRYADTAKAWSGGKSSQELIGVYSRIKQHYREEGLVDDNEYIEKVYFSKKQPETKREPEETVSEKLIPEEEKNHPEEGTEKIVNCNIRATIGVEEHNFNVKCEVKQLLDFLNSVGAKNWTVEDEKESKNELQGKDDNSRLELLQRLKNLRLEIARAEGIAAFRVFSDKILLDMVQRLPQTSEDMMQIKGVGPNNYVKYGVRFKQVICDYLAGK